MTKPATFPLPTPVAGPAPLPTLHNATPYEQAVGIAREMNRRLQSGDDSPAKNVADRNMMYGLVGRDGALPEAIEAIIREGAR